MDGTTFDWPPEAPDTELPDTELPELTDPCPLWAVDVEPVVVEWPGKALLTYMARAATAATEATPIILAMDRERMMAASRWRLAAPRGSWDRRPVPDAGVGRVVITDQRKEGS